MERSFLSCKGDTATSLFGKRKVGENNLRSVNKRRRIVTADLRTTDDLLNVVLNNEDLLCHVVEFFISRPFGVVDACTLLNMSLVCKAWYNAINVPSLWPNNGIKSSLQMLEVSSQLITKPSLIGFVKLGQLHDNQFDTSFRARERASCNQVILSVAKTDHIHSQVLQELFMAHRIQGSMFLTLEGSQKFRNYDFPCGVILPFNKRMLRWYNVHNDENDDNTETSSLAYNTGGATQRNNGTSNDIVYGKVVEMRTKSAIQLLLDFEKDRPDATRQHVRLDHLVPMVDWIVEVVECFDLDDSVAYRTMSYFDRVMSTTRIKLKGYQLVAGACLIIACKCSNGACVSAQDIKFCADNSFTVAQVNDTERIILHKLNWQLAHPTVWDYIDALALSKHHQLYYTVHYIAELSLQSNIYLTHSPSVIACSCLILGNITLGTNPNYIWPRRLELETGLSRNDLNICVLELSQSLNRLRSMFPSFNMVSRRYRKEKRLKVGDIAFPVVDSLATLNGYFVLP